MVAKGTEAQSPLHRSGPGGPGLPVPDDEGPRQGEQRRSGDDYSEDPRKAQGRAGEPLRQKDGDLRNPEGNEHIRKGGGVGPRPG